MKKLLKMEELVEMGFGCSQTIMKKVRNDEFPCPIKLGRSKRSAMRWLENDIDIFLKNPNLKKHIITRKQKINNFLENNSATNLAYSEKQKEALKKFHSINCKNFLMRPIEELGLPNYTTRNLKIHNVYLVGQLVLKTEWDIFKMENVGKKSLKEIQNNLDHNGWRLSKTSKEFA